MSVSLRFAKAPLFATLPCLLLGLVLTEPSEATPKQQVLENEIGDLSRFLQDSLPSCSTDSVLVFFEQESASGEHKGDTDIAAQCVALSDGAVRWNAEKATIVSASVYSETQPQAISDGHGGAITVFQAEMRTGEHAGDTEIFAQRIGQNGRLEWQNGERSVVVASSNWREQKPLILPSKDQSFIVIYELSISTGQHAGDVDISANRIDVNGELVWKSNSSTGVSNGQGIERAPTAIADGEGGALVFFEAEARTGEMAGISAVLGQRIDSKGERRWNGGEYPSVIAMTDWAERAPKAISDGANGAFILFERHGLSGEYKGDVDVAAQRIGADGAIVWQAEHGVALGDSTLLERNAQLVGDGQGGFVAVFEVEPPSGEHAGNADLYGQRVSAEGERLWNGGKPALLASSLWKETGHHVLPDGKGGVFIVFEQHAPVGQYAGDVDIAGVHVGADGQHIWGLPERPVDLSKSSKIERNPRGIATADGGLAVVFEVEARTGEFAGDTEVYMHRFAPDGSAAWENPLPLASSRLLERSPVAMTP